MGAKIHLTGRLRLEGPGGVVEEHDLAGPQARLALAALVHVRRPVERDWLAEVVWNAAPPDGWSASLNAIVSKLRGELDRAGIGRSALVSTAGTYELSLPPGTWVDAEDAVRRADRAEGAARRGDVPAALSDATVASSILQRPFLPSVDSSWADGVRRELADRLHRSYVLLATGWNAAGDHQLAAVVAERAIALDPLRETAHRELIAAEIGRGDTAAATRAFERCVAILADELGVAPSERTRAALDAASG